MIQVIDGKIKQYKLPSTGTLKDGRTVSGYHLLDAETLKQEGWLPLEDITPKYNNETQYLIHDGYKVFEDKVVKLYVVKDIPEPEPDELVALKERLNATELALIELMMEG